MYGEDNNILTYDINWIDGIIYKYETHTAHIPQSICAYCCKQL